MVHVIYSIVSGQCSNAIQVCLFWINTGMNIWDKILLLLYKLFSDDDIFRREYHPLKHLISNTRPAATMRRPRSVTLTYLSEPIHSEYDIDYSYISSPSIPKTHMPFSALKRQVKRGWENSHYVREMSVPTGRDSMKFSQWNDVSE